MDAFVVTGWRGYLNVADGGALMYHHWRVSRSETWFHWWVEDDKSRGSFGWIGAFDAPFFTTAAAGSFLATFPFSLGAYNAGFSIN